MYVGSMYLMLHGMLSSLQCAVIWSLRGKNDCTPETDTSEIVVDFHWRFPMDFQRHVPTGFHLSVVFDKGLPLAQWTLLELSNGCSVALSNGLSLLRDPVSCSSTDNNNDENDSNSYTYYYEYVNY